ncbi:hypothetical protein JCM11641_007315 [Rhodosporidiobolus odoratus]
MDYSVHPYAQPSKPPLHSLPTLPTSSHQTPSTRSQLPPQPRHHAHLQENHRGPASSASPAAVVAAANGTPHSDPNNHYPQRQRGESSPVDSRHSQPSDPFGALAYDQQGRPIDMRRQSSGPGATVSRRRVLGSPPRNQSSRLPLGDDIDFSSTELGAAPILSAASLPPPRHPPRDSPKEPHSTSSKSVLTVALQRAQSAVLLDSANNFTAAIQAYAQSVRLLKQVMARVEDGSREMERKISTGGIREGETQEDLEKRRQRYERKEKAKVDEARRLRVIHDTYEDRVRMLVQMGTPLPPGTVLSPSLISLATSTMPELSSPPLLSNRPSDDDPSADPIGASRASVLGSPPHPSSDGRPPSMVYRRRRAPGEADEQRSISSLREVSAPPTTLAGHLSPREGGSSAAAVDIGSAMLHMPPSPRPAEPFDDVPQITRLPVTEGDFGALLTVDIGGPEDDQTLLAVSSPRRRALSAASDSTTTATAATTPKTARPLPLSTTASSPPDQHNDSIDAASHSQHVSPQAGDEEHPAPSLPPSQSDSSLSSTSSGENDEPLHTALEYGVGWPSSHTRQSSAPSASAAEHSPEDTVEGLAPLPPRLEERRPSPSSLAMRRGSSASAITNGSEATVRPGGEGMRRAASAQSAGAGPAEFEVRPRPSRGASLVGSSVAMASNFSSSSATSSEGKQPLVNSSVMEGTISQRRLKSPQASVDLAPPIPMPSGLPGTSIIVRAPSSETDRTSEQYAPLPLPAPPPTRSAGAAPTGFSASSLPGRLRALSQPGSKRPKLQTFDCEQPPPRPPLPPLLNLANRSASSAVAHAPSASMSSSTGSASRKGSVPTPTSLYAPQVYPSLGRSNSSSSMGSSASSVYRTDRSATLNGGNGTPVSGVFPASSFRSTAASSVTTTQHHFHPSQSGGVFLSAGLPSPPLPSSIASRDFSGTVPAVRKPFHLMRLVISTIPVSSSAAGGAGKSGGGYLSEKLFVPSAMWTQAGAKLVALETKVRMLELISSGLLDAQNAGKGLLLVPTHSSAAARIAQDEAIRFARELDSFEGMTEAVQSTLGKKLGQGVFGATGGGIGGGSGSSLKGDKDPKTGRKGSSASFSAWSSKLSMSLNRVTNGGANLDSQATYVDTLARVFKQAQVLDQHLALLFPSPTDVVPTADEPSNPYLLLPDIDRHRLERQLRKASEFFGVVVCRFVMRDTAVLLDKFVKRGGGWLEGEI